MSKRIKDHSHVVIINDLGEVLCVSRKDDFNDFGLPGGKIEKSDINPETAGIREVKEETGIDIHSMILLYAEHRRGSMGYTYLATSWSGEISHEEPHVAKWGTFCELVDGKFGEWNLKVFRSYSDLRKTKKYKKLIDNGNGKEEGDSNI
jgi:8-oxo-dGTP pyrophosphatase MutT (NUDIX family)